MHVLSLERLDFDTHTEMFLSITLLLKCISRMSINRRKQVLWIWLFWSKSTIEKLQHWNYGWTKK